jgi:hypothetical protein
MATMTLAEAAPIACTLHAAEFRSRRAKLADLNRTALESYRRDDLRLELLYAIEARSQVLEMVRAEQTCCTFLTFEIREEHDALRVIVEAPERARDVAESLFDAFYSATPGQEPRGCKTGTASTDRVVGASAALAATGALACGICCVLPFALPAAVLVVGGGVVSWFAKATPWAIAIASLAVLAGWAWTIVQSVRTKRRPARSTLLTLALATAVFAAAALWWHFEREIIHLLR